MPRRNVRTNPTTVTVNAVALRNSLDVNELLALREMKSETPAPTSNSGIDMLWAISLEELRKSDPQHADYLESLDSLVAPKAPSLEDSYRRARKMRDNYRSWLFRTLDGIEEARAALVACPDTTPEDIDLFDEDNNPTFFENEIARTQHADDLGISPWQNRQKLSAVEYGIVEEFARNPVGWTVDLDIDGYPNSERADTASEFFNGCTSIANDETDYSFINTEEVSFATKEEAQQFVNKTRATFKTKGDTSREIIKCWIDRTREEPYMAKVLVSELNWDHKNRLAAERDRHVENAIRRIETSTSRNELNRHVSICKRYSRDMQVRNTGQTFDKSETCWRFTGIGWDYTRFATVMNAIADRAKELKLRGFRTYKINEFESSRKPVDGDMLDCGCSQGSFLIEDNAEQEAREEMIAEAEGTYMGRRHDSEILQYDEKALDEFENYRKSSDMPCRTTSHRSSEYVFGPAALRVSGNLSTRAA